MSVDPLDMLAAARAAAAPPSTKDRPITRAVNAWKNNGSVYERAAIDRVVAVMLKDLLTDDRSHSEGRMRPSSIANPCRRFQALSYSGFEKAPFSEKSLGFMDSGTWAHYQWQAMLLSAYIQGFGGITDIEVPVVYDPWKLSGSMDGEQPDLSIFELKTTGYFKYHGGKYSVGVKNMAEPTLDHLEQINGYMKAKGVEWASIVYLSRDNNNDFVEFRVKFDQAIFDSKDREMKSTLATIRKGELPAMLDSCAMVLDGTAISLTKEKKAEAEGVFDRCEFHHICPRAIL